MSGIPNKNLIFYSNYPNDKLSQMCLAKLDKMPEMNKQFIRICIHHPRDYNKPPIINLPSKVHMCKSKGLIPILAIAGFKEPIFAQSALSWINESALNQDDGIAPSNIHGQGTADNCCTIEQAGMGGNSLFETDYNIGFSGGKGEFNKAYANIDEAAENRIVTYDEVNDKTAAANEIAQRLEQLKFKRDIDVPQTQPRIGGAGGGAFPPQMGGSAPNGMPQMPQMPQRQMPQMPMGGSGMPQMPQMPMQGGSGMPGMMLQMPMQGGSGMPGMMPQMPMQGGSGMPQMPQMPQMPMQGGMPQGMPQHRSKRRHR